MTFEMVCWGENTELRLLDEIGCCRQAWVKTTPWYFTVAAEKPVDAKAVFWAMVLRGQPPYIGGVWANMHPYTVGRELLLAEARKELENAGIKEYEIMKKCEKCDELARLLIECRDALPAISMASARLHGVSLSLATRIESALKPWEAPQ
jgi:hypothetical protein